MNLTPESYAKICKQSAFISALVAGFSFDFPDALLVRSIKNKIADWVMIFSFLSISGLLICSLVWTLTASRMEVYIGGRIAQVPQTFLRNGQAVSIHYQQHA
jgi:hypothetical protein